LAGFIDVAAEGGMAMKKVDLGAEKAKVLAEARGTGAAMTCSG